MTVKSATLVAIRCLALALILRTGLDVHKILGNPLDYYRSMEFYLISLTLLLRDGGLLVFLVTLYRRQGSTS